MTRNIYFHEPSTIMRRYRDVRALPVADAHKVRLATVLAGHDDPAEVVRRHIGDLMPRQPEHLNVPRWVAWAHRARMEELIDAAAGVVRTYSGSHAPVERLRDLARDVARDELHARRVALASKWSTYTAGAAFRDAVGEALGGAPTAETPRTPAPPPHWRDALGDPDGDAD